MKLSGAFIGAPPDGHAVREFIQELTVLYSRSIEFLNGNEDDIDQIHSHMEIGAATLRNIIEQYTAEDLTNDIHGQIYSKLVLLQGRFQSALQNIRQKVDHLHSKCFIKLYIYSICTTLIEIKFLFFQVTLFLRNVILIFQITIEYESLPVA